MWVILFRRIRMDGLTVASNVLKTFLVIRLTDMTLDQARQYVGPSDEGLYYFSRYYLPVHDLLSADEIRQIAAADWSGTGIFVQRNGG